MSSSPTTIPTQRVSASEGPAPAGGARVLALDRLRGLALVSMVVHHLTDWLTGDAREVLPGWSSFSVTDVAHRRSSWPPGPRRPCSWRPGDAVA